MPQANPGSSPVAGPCSQPVQVPAGEHFVVPASLPRGEGERLVAEAIPSGFFRPADVDDRTRTEPTSLAYLPVWRIDVEVEGFHVGLSHHTGGDGKLRYVLPTGGARHRDDVVIVLARRFLPFDIASKVEIEPADMRPYEAPRADGEWVEADVPRADAEHEASARLRHAVEPNSALISKYEARIRSSALCHYPVWLGRYQYRGEATTRVVEDCWVAVSARTGKVVGSHHPSALRSVVGKVKRLFGGWK